MEDNSESIIKPQGSTELSNKDLHIHKVHKLSRYFLIFASFIALGSSILFFYFYFTYQPPQTTFSLTPKPQTKPLDETANWKTYTNIELGFSIKYPEKIQEYYFPGINSGSNIEISLPSIKHPYLTGKDNNITIMWSSDPGLTPQKNIDILIQQQKSRTPSSIFERSSYIVDDKKGEMVLEKRPPDYELRHLAVQANKTILMFSVMYQTKNKEKTLKLFDQILSTFEFTSGNSAPTPTCMKRPACLDETPRCLIPEPANGWCP